MQNNSHKIILDLTENDDKIFQFKPKLSPINIENVNNYKDILPPPPPSPRYHNQSAFKNYFPSEYNQSVIYNAKIETMQSEINYHIDRIEYLDRTIQYMKNEIRPELSLPVKKRKYGVDYM